VDEWIRSAEGRLAKAGVPDSRLDAQMLAAHALSQERSWILAHPEAEVPIEAEAFLKRREQREPLAYILGWREFYGRRFQVVPGVLVPRQETETLVEVALEGLGGKVLDVGTGTGCLAVTIKLERPTWMVAACDISQTAVSLARTNAHALDATVHVTRSDMFEAFMDTQFGVIVSNPPYVATGAELPPEVAGYEPHEALYAGLDGLDFYRRLALEARHRLVSWGRLIVELGDGMEPEVSAMFTEHGWTVVEARPDLGGMPRALVLTP